MSMHATSKILGSAAPTSQAAVSQGSYSQFVEFYLGSVWTWTECGRQRLRNFMESLNVDRPTYSFDRELQAVKIRCPKNSAVYIRRRFAQFMQEIEDEYRQSEQAIDIVRQDGTLANSNHHPDVRLPTFIPNTQRLPVVETLQSDTSASVEGRTSQDEVPAMSLVVPDELRDSPHIVVWQDLQAKNKNFEGTHFFSPAAKAAIEFAHNVRIITDSAQKVVFIGSSASLGAAKVAKANLTRLLQDHQASRKPPSISHHIFYVDSPTVWTIDTREITQINPILAPSTILDPWKYPVPEQYGLFHDAEGVFALRVCLEEPLRNGQRNMTWSLFGPRAHDVFNGRRAKRSSPFFDGLRAARHPRAQGEQVPDTGIVSNWLQEINMPVVVDEATVSTTEVVGVTHTPSQGVGENDPIPLNFDPSRRPGTGTEAMPRQSVCEDDPVPLDFDPSKRPGAELEALDRSPYRGGSGSAGRAAKAEPTSLLDQQDAVLYDYSSTLQRAMQPSQRLIIVPVPEMMDSEPLSRCKSPPQASEDYHSRATSVVNTQTRAQKELSIFTTSVGRLLERMKGRYGMISVRAEIGRYYACAVPESGRAVNQRNDPAWGWEPDDLRRKIESNQHCIFTKALTSWGNDADFLGSMFNEPISRGVFFDFRFQATLSKIPLDMVLEVNAEDYTWKLRLFDNTDDVVYVHCLAQHWDFQVAVTYDRPLEYRANWTKFAHALVESLEVKPPELEFQHTFSEASVTGHESPIIIEDVRARQVCRFQHQNKKTYLDITRILPTRLVTSQDPKYRKVRGVLAKSSVDKPCAGDNPLTGEFAQWFEASVSSVRLEELLQQNQDMIPGDEADWSVEQIEQEKLMTDIYQQAAEIVKKMDGVGVECDNGHELRRPKVGPTTIYQW